MPFDTNVTAEAIETFRSEGELDRFEACSIELGEAAGIDLRLEAGGMLFFRCRRRGTRSYVPRGSDIR